MIILHTILPLLLLVALGAGLARIRFLGASFMADLNRLAFWVALPALLFRSVVHAESPGQQTFHLLGVLVIATLLTAAIGWLAAVPLRLPPGSRGTLSQSAFRGNMAYIGVPVLSYAFAGVPGGKESFATAVIVMALLMALYNVIAVFVLQASRREGSRPFFSAALRSIFTNPLLISGLAGLPFAFTHTSLPVFFDRALESLAGAAVPIALLCIGGSLAQARIGHRLNGIVSAALLKTAGMPLITLLLIPAFHLHPAEIRIALVLAACPTAAAAYIMAREMDGDESLASGSIVLSTVFSAASLPLALLLSS